MGQLELTFHGAAGEVTGSMHRLDIGDRMVLLDAGLFQGRRAEARAKNAELPIEAGRVDAVVLSHAHIDHAGRLPLLTRWGLNAPILCTPATRDLSAIMLADAAFIQMKDAEFLRKHGKAGPVSEPLYDAEDAAAVQKRMMTVGYLRPHQLLDGLLVTFRDAGHILGSASVDLAITYPGGSHRLVFSGDIGRKGMPVIRDPDPPSGPIDTLIIESTYATKLHETVGVAEQTLGEIVSRTAARGGKVLIPSFAVGRAQELIYALHSLHRAGQIPHLPIYVDSPLAVEATAIFRLHPELFDRHERLVSETADLFDFPLVSYVRRVEDSRALNGLPGGAVIIAASGMAESGRILHHLKHHGNDRKNTILFVGFQAEHTLGRKIQEGQRTVTILGDPVEIEAEIVTLGGYSAHADRDELRSWVRALGGPVRRAFVVHGERGPLSAMAEILKQEGVNEVYVPRLGESHRL